MHNNYIPLVESSFLIGFIVSLKVKIFESSKRSQRWCSCSFTSHTDSSTILSVDILDAQSLLACTSTRCGGKAASTMAYCSVTSTQERFASCLSNFQIHDLLVLKKSMELMGHTESHKTNDAESFASCSETAYGPQRMALMASDRSDRGTSSIAASHPWQMDSASWVEEKPSKLQTLFQISITALAFLSFGGYLLCLIVQAIKSKGTTYFHPVATATTTNTNGSVKRIKIYRRSRRRRSIHDAHIHISSLLLGDYATYMKSVRDQQLGYGAHLVGS